MLNIFEANMDPKEGGTRRPPPFLGSGRRPRPYICFKSTQNILFGLYFEYIVERCGCLRLSFLCFFRNPSESSVLYFLRIFRVFPRDPPKWSILYILSIFRDSRKSQSVAVRNSVTQGSQIDITSKE